MLLLFLLSVYEVQGRKSQAATDVTMEKKEEQNTNQKQTTKNDDAQNNPVAFWDISSHYLALMGSDKNPDPLSDQVDIEKRTHYQKPKEFLIIFTAYAIVQKIAVVIKFLSAAPALSAMVRTQQPPPTLSAEGKHGGIYFVSQLNIVDNSIDWVMGQDPQIIVYDAYQECKMQSQHDIEDGKLSDFAIDDSRKYIDEVQCNETQVQYDGEDAFERGLSRESIFSLVLHLAQIGLTIIIQITDLQ